MDAHGVFQKQTVVNRNRLEQAPRGTEEVAVDPAVVEVEDIVRVGPWLAAAVTRRTEGVEEEQTQPGPEPDISLEPLRWYRGKEFQQRLGHFSLG